MATEIINREKIQNSFEELETKKLLLTNCTQLWKTLSDHYSSLEQSLLQKTKTLDSKLETLDSETKKSLEALEERENSIPERESSAIARIEEQKQVALTEIEKTETGNLELEEGLKIYCRNMDSKRLLKYMVSKRKESVSLREKIQLAITESVDSFRLVLDAIDEFVSHKSDKIGVSDRRWACGSLIQAIFPVLDLDGKKNPRVSGSIAERAGLIAESWKVKMDNQESEEFGPPAEAAMFLQMVVGFGLKSRFEEDFLKKLILKFPSRKEMPKLASSLGFGEKMGDIIDELVKSGKEIEAVDFACESGMTERFSPVSLLRTYLRNSRKNANTILKNGHYNSAATESASVLELTSLKAIIRCVEEHKLEDQFTLDSLRKRVTQLEKIREDKRKTAPVPTKPQNKRARGIGGGGSGGGGNFRPAKTGRGANPYPSYGRRNLTPPLHHQHPAAGYSGPYGYPNQSMYDVPPPTSYSGLFSGGISRSPAQLPQTYPYKPEDIAVGGSRSSAAAAAYQPQPPSYSGYDYSSGASTTYQPSYPQ